MLQARALGGSRRGIATTLRIFISGVLAMAATVVPAPGHAAVAADTTPPGVVKKVTTSDVTHNHVTLSWTNPATGDFAGVMIRRRSGATPPTKSGGTLVGTTGAFSTSFDDFGLDPSKTYTYGLFSFDEVPNYSVAVPKTITTPSDDVVAPGPVTDLRAVSATTTSISFAWTNPGDSRLRRSRGSSPQGCGGAGRPERGRHRPRHRAGRDLVHRLRVGVRSDVLVCVLPARRRGELRHVDHPQRRHGHRRPRPYGGLAAGASGARAEGVVAQRDSDPADERRARSTRNGASPRRVCR